MVLNSRLEQPTKFLRAENLKWQDGLFRGLVTCELPRVLQQESATRSWQQLTQLPAPVPDFPQVHSIFYSSFVTGAAQASLLSRAVWQHFPSQS